jgi:two-component system sensor histidine kinase/response regulator
MEPAPHARILVIEDDPAIRATLIDILELNNYRVVHAANGAEGFALARSARPDVILTDLSMPTLDGFTLIAALRAEESTRPIPVIIISASVEPERMRRGMDLGAEDFIVKPFTEEQVLRSIRARLEKKALLDELDAFSHTVAHDLKNPIAVLTMSAELLRMTWESNDAATNQKRLAAIEANAKRLGNIVDELLVLAGVQRQTVQLRPVEMESVVQEALDRMENLVQQSQAKIENPSQWPVAFGHAPWITEIWANYLSNAVKYGGSPPSVRLGADLDSKNNTVRFWVQDNGAGLTEEQRSRLFLQFSRVTETRAKGHGLGLSIVRRITDKLGGRAGVDSQVDVGSRFWFELPASEPTPPTIAAPLLDP